MLAMDDMNMGASGTNKTLDEYELESVIYNRECKYFEVEGYICIDG